VNDTNDSVLPRFTPPRGVARRVLVGLVAAVALLGGLLPQRALAHSGFPRATCVVIAQDGRALTSDDYGRLIAWTIPDLSPVKFDQQHAGKAAYVATAGNRVLTAGYDGNVFIHDLDDPHKKNEPFTGHRSEDGKREVWVAIFSPDGSHAVSGANDGQILLWDPNDVQKPPREFRYQDKKKEKKNAGGPTAGLAFLPPRDKKQRLLSTHGYGDVHLWEFDFDDKEEPVIVKTFSHGNSRPVNAVVVLKNGFFLSAGFDQTLRLWDPDDNREQPQELRAYRNEHTDWIWRVAYSDKLQLAATASEDGFVGLWDAHTDPDNLKNEEKRKSLARSKVTEHGLMGLAFTNNGRLVVTLDGTEAQNDPDHIKGLIKIQ
jgi:WD40 repeat protein